MGQILAFPEGFQMHWCNFLSKSLEIFVFSADCILNEEVLSTLHSCLQTVYSTQSDLGMFSVHQPL